MKNIILAATLVCSSFSVLSAPVVIGNTGAAELSSSQAKKLFLGKMKKLPGAGKVTILELPVGDATRVAFHAKVTKKNESQLKSYWSRLVFTGKGTAPTQLNNADQVKQTVSANPNAVGYIDDADLDDTVKVLLKL